MVEGKPAAGRPLSLDDNGLLSRGLQWVALRPIEARLMTVRLENMNRVVRRTDLVNAGWPSGPNGTRSLDTRLKRLRARIQPLGLTIGNVRQRGLVLSFSDERS